MKYLTAGIFIIIGIILYGLTSNDIYRFSIQQPDEKLDLSWEEEKNSLSLLNKGTIVWQLNYDNSEDKPYFYPLRTLNGINLALERPEDHPWHRGLWFSWKYINGVNYWEEEPGSGVSEGRSIIKDVRIQRKDDFSAEVHITVDYTPDRESVLLSEARTLQISKPDENGDYIIDWHQKFETHDESVVLDRTPPEEYGGETWGGYAGLGYRADDNELSLIHFRNSDGWTNENSLTGFGQKANWMDLTGTSTAKQKAGLTIFDHPSNLRHPAPWYVWYNRGGEEGASGYNHAFFQPALLFHKPYKLGPEESFALKYRVLVHSWEPDMGYLNDVYQEFIEE